MSVSGSAAHHRTGSWDIPRRGPDPTRLAVPGRSPAPASRRERRRGCPPSGTTGDREWRWPAPRERRGPSEPTPGKQWRERDVGRGRRRRAGKGLRPGGGGRARGVRHPGVLRPRARGRIRAGVGGPEERTPRAGGRGRRVAHSAAHPPQPARSLAARSNPPSLPPSAVPPHSPAPPHRSNPSAQLPQPPRRAPSPPPPPRHRPQLAPGQGPALCSVLGLCRKSWPRRCSLEGGPASASHRTRGTSNHRTPGGAPEVMRLKNPTISFG